MIRIKKKKVTKGILALIFLSIVILYMGQFYVSAEENEELDYQDRIALAEELGVSEYVDENGYLLDEYLEGKSHLDLDGEISSLIQTTSDENLGNIYQGSGNIGSNSIMSTFSSMIRAISSVSNTVTSYEKVVWDNGYGSTSGYFQVSTSEHGDDIVAFCIEHSMTTPGVGTELGEPTLSTNDTLRKVLYYGYGGPEDIGLYSSNSEGIVKTSIAASSANGDTSSSMGDGLLTAIEGLDIPPDSFKVYTIEPTSSSLQTLAYWIYEPAGTLTLEKSSSNADITDDNTYYSLSGAVYGVYTDSSASDIVGELVTTSIGKSNTLTLDEGTYYVKEIEAPTGYTLDTTIYTVDVASGSDATVSVEDVPKTDPVSLLLSKVDSELNTGNAQGDATLADAQYTFEFYSGFYTSDPAEQGISPLRTWVLKTDSDGYTELSNDYLVSGDEFYYDSNGFETLPIGTLVINETKAPEGYLLDTTTYVVQITDEGSVEYLYTYNAPISVETVITGGIRIAKYDLELNEGTPQGDGTLEGAEFEIINRSSNAVIVDGNIYEVGETIISITTDASGIALTELNLPYGTYGVVEVVAPEGYTLNSTERTVIVETDGAYTNLTTSSTAIKNMVMKGEIEIAKFDSELDEASAQGGATLSGTEIDIINRSEQAVYVEGILYEPDEVIMTIVTNEDGIATTGIVLPYGTYGVIETSAPEGYLLNEPQEQVVSIRSDNELVSLTDSQTAIQNQVIRGDLELIKISDGDMTRLANIPFKITSVTTGESHIIVTDANGYASTASSWNLHGNNTNEGITEFDGVWFGELSELSEDKGALIYDTYYIEELPAENNQGMILTEPFLVTIYRDSTTVNLGTLTNDYEPDPEITSFAVDLISNSKTGYLTSNTTILDTVYYTNLEAGTYTLKAILMDKNTEEELTVNGETIEASITFTNSEIVGEIEVELSFDGTNLSDDIEIVVYQRLYDANGNLIAEHTDIDSASQKVTYYTPTLSTYATDYLSGDKVGTLDYETIIIDTATYSNLQPDTYLVKGTLMLQDTEEAFLVNGESVTFESEVDILEPNGTIELQFIFDGTDFVEEQSFVVFTEIYELNGTLLVAHKDIQSNEQTVTYELPDIEIGTTALDKETETHNGEMDEENTIIDTVTYSGLFVGKTYKIEGILMDTSTGEPLLINGKEITSSIEFTPEESEGSVELLFTFEGLTIPEQVEIVVFENLYHSNGTLLAVHADIDDPGQTVEYVMREASIGTIANDEETGTHVGELSEQITIIDTVKYEGLYVNQEYTIKGILMDKTTGAELLIDGEKVEVSQIFVPETADGEIEVAFTFDGLDIDKESIDIVVFEYLYDFHSELIAAHTDLDDEGQTVTYIRREANIGTTAKDEITQDNYGELDEQVTIVDIVTYSGLYEGQTYTIKGVLMDKITGQPLLINGEMIEVTKTFVPETTDGEVEVIFTFEGLELTEDLDIVVFEYLYDFHDNLVAEHTDITDEKQTVSYKYPVTDTVTEEIKTGDSAKVGVLLALSSMSALGMFAILKKRRSLNFSEKKS